VGKAVSSPVKSRFVSWILWALVVIIAIWSVVYFIEHFSDSSFTESAMGNLFATTIGVLVGVPIALEVNRRQQIAVSTVAANERQIYESERKRKVLTLLRSELSANHDDILIRRKPIESGGKRDVYIISLSDQMWSVFSDGGELQYVNNPELLAAIANAYHLIRHSIMLENKILDAIHFPGMKIHQDKPPQDYFLEYLTGSDPELIATIETAIMATNAELELLI
jgi:hypothetical protein